MKLGMFGGVVAGAFMIGCGTAQAGAPNPVERAGDRQELREDRRETGADRWDKARLEALHAQYVAARAARNLALVGQLDRRVLAELQHEIGESKVETAEKAAEVRESGRERAGERREVVKDVVRGRPVKAARDARDLADDRRDVRDDRRDLAAEAAALARKRDIRDAYLARMGQLDPASLAAKEALIQRAIGEAAVEVRADVKEKVEDRKELREDRRDVRRPD